jgi:ribosome-associated protein
MDEIKGMAMQIAEVMDTKKGEDILIIDVMGKASYADYLVIGTGLNVKHVSSLADAIEDELAKKNIFVSRKDGYKTGEWIVMDFRDIMVHLFVEEKRHFYNIEKIWNDAKKIEVRIDTVQ